MRAKSETKTDVISRLLDIPSTDPEDARRRKLLNIMLLSVAMFALTISVVLFVVTPMGLAGEQEEVRLL